MTRLSREVLRNIRLFDEKKGKRAPKPVSLPLAQVKWDAKLFPGGVWIQIPFLLESMNVWLNWHWTVKKKYKDELSEAIHRLKMAFNLPQFELATIQVIYYFTVRRQRDYDNRNPKFLNDALVRAGILVDDNSELVSNPEPEFKIDKERPRTEVFIYRRD